MGADRRGPLAAFIVVAIIAVVLLVTSVRSQAAPWLDPDKLSTSVVDQAVHDGAGLVRRAASATSDVASDGQDPVPTGTQDRATTLRHHHTPDARSPSQPRAGTPTSPSAHDHGRHLGWAHAPAHGGRSSSAASEHVNEHGHGHGQGHGQGHGHGGSGDR